MEDWEVDLVWMLDLEDRNPVLVQLSQERCRALSHLGIFVGSDFQNNLWLSYCAHAVDVPVQYTLPKSMSTTRITGPLESRQELFDWVSHQLPVSERQRNR